MTTNRERAEKIVNSDEMSPYVEDYKPSQKGDMVHYIAAQLDAACREAVKNHHIAGRYFSQAYDDGFYTCQTKAVEVPKDILNFKVFPNVSPTMQYPAGYQQGYRDAIIEMSDRLRKLES